VLSASQGGARDARPLAVNTRSPCGLPSTASVLPTRFVSPSRRPTECLPESWVLCGRLSHARCPFERMSTRAQQRALCTNLLLTASRGHCDSLLQCSNTKLGHTKRRRRRTLDRRACSVCPIKACALWRGTAASLPPVRRHVPKVENRTGEQISGKSEAGVASSRGSATGPGWTHRLSPLFDP